MYAELSKTELTNEAVEFTETWFIVWVVVINLPLNTFVPVPVLYKDKPVVLITSVPVNSKFPFAVNTIALFEVALYVPLILFIVPLNILTFPVVEI